MKFRKKQFNFIKFFFLCLLISSQSIWCHTNVSSNRVSRRFQKHTYLKSKFQRTGDDGEELLPPDDLGAFYNKYRQQQHRRIDGENVTINQILGHSSTTYFRDNPFSRNQTPYKFQDCDRGFDFPGVYQESLKEQVERPLRNSYVSFLANPIIGALSNYIESSVAYGDFAASEIKNDNGPLASFNCNYIPMDEESTFGIIGYKGDRFPCGESEHHYINLCLAFDHCGTVAISTDGDSLKCLANISDLGDVLMQSSDYINNTSFGLSFRQRFPKSLTLGKINENGTDIILRMLNHRGNAYFSVKGSLPDNIPFQIGGKPLKELFEIESPEISLSLSFGQNEVENANVQIRNNRKGFFKWLTSIGVEIAIQASGIVKFKLDEITYGLFPDITLDIKNLDAIVTLGEGSTGLPTGFYAFLKAKDITNYTEAEQQFFNQFKAILKKIGYIDPNFSYEKSVYFSIEVSIDGIGIYFYGENHNIKCFLNFSPFTGSCNLHRIFVTFLLKKTLQGYNWIVKKAKDLLDKTGKKLVEFKAQSRRFLQNSSKAIENLASRVINQATDDIRNAVDSVVDGINTLAEDRHTRGLLNWISPIFHKRKFRKLRKI